MKRPWMPLYIADYLKDTTHLGALESGAYLHLIMDYWQNGKLPEDDRLLARIAKLTDREWKRCRPVLQAFFHDGWKHKRIDAELAHAEEVSSKRRNAANARHAAKAEQEACNGDANAPPNADTVHSTQRKNTEADASGADAPRDVRKDLFGKGLEALARITGKTPDSCRSLVGRWLKSVNDEAIHVLGAIEDAERNRVADPVAWITRALQPRMNSHGTPAKRTVHDAARDLTARVRALDEPAPGLRDGTGGGAVRLLPAR